MKILDRYVAHELLKTFLFGIIALILVSTVVDIFERIDDIVRNKPPLSVCVTFFLARIPQVLFMIAPISMLLSVLLVTGAFSRNSEIIAILASGTSIYRIIIPLLVIGFVTSLLMMGLNEFIIPTANRITEENKRIMKGRPDIRTMPKIQIWFRGTEENRIYYINALIPEKRELQGLTVFELNEHFVPIQRLDAQRAVYFQPQSPTEEETSAQDTLKSEFFELFNSEEDEGENGNGEGRWELYRGVERSLEDPENSTLMTFQRRRKYVIPHTFEEFRRDTKDPEDMNYRELTRYIEALTASGSDVSRYIVDLRGKISFPFVSLVMVIIGYPFALKSPRSGTTMSVGLSVFIGLVYWIILQLGIALGHAHILPPLLAAWISHIIFASAGFYLILSTKT